MWEPPIHKTEKNSEDTLVKMEPLSTQGFPLNSLASSERCPFRALGAMEYHLRARRGRLKVDCSFTDFFFFHSMVALPVEHLPVVSGSLVVGGRIVYS